MRQSERQKAKDGNRSRASKPGPLVAFGLSLLALPLLPGGCAGPGGGAASPQGAVSSDAFDSGGQTPNAATLFRLSRVLAAQGRENEARYVLQDLAVRFPTYPRTYCELAEIHMRAGRNDEALEALSRGIKANPADARLIGNLGMCYMVKGDFARSLACFQKASSLGADDARHRANMAAALGMLGRYEESLAEYEKVLPPATAHYNVAVLARARKDRATANAEFTIASRMGERLPPPITSATR